MQPTEVETYNVIGVMSGTSLDGLDLAHCQFGFNDGNWTFELLNSRTVGYQENLRDSLFKATTLEPVELLKLDRKLGVMIGQEINLLMKDSKFPVDFVASHGHTVFHQPENGFTLQIGSGQEIANQVQKPVLCDFRSKDVSLRGQGAPLVPIGDKLLFPSFDFCLNLGGIANASFEDSEKGRVSFDICPANMILNYLANKINLKFDQNGEMARSGKILSEVLRDLNSLSYYQHSYPKSLGFEWFDEKVIPMIDNNSYEVKDLLNTAVEHISEQIFRAISPALSDAKSAMLITGGGVHNSYLIERIKSKFDGKLSIEIPQQSIIDFKEAIIFGLLGVLRWRNEINCLKSVTGASKDSSGGVIFMP